MVSTEDEDEDEVRTGVLEPGLKAVGMSIWRRQ